MDLFGMIVITLHISTVFAKKKYTRKSNTQGEKSDESVEYSKLLYKDCKHNKKEPTPMPEQMRQAPRNPECPCPKMCCSMCCECNDQPYIGRQMAPLQQALGGMPFPNNVEPMQVAPQPQRHPSIPVQPQIVQRGGKKKKKITKPDAMLQPPIGGRRDFGFTRENIKNLIAQDQDIKKILKDLVRVTMHKVDLVEKVKTRRNMNVPTATPAEDVEYLE